VSHLENDVTAQLVYTVDQAAAAIGKGRNFIYEEIAARRLKSFKLGNSRRIAHVDLVAFLNAMRSAADSKAQARRVPRS
jgi:excisionase family DNA binding protein